MRHKTDLVGIFSHGAISGDSVIHEDDSHRLGECDRFELNLALSHLKIKFFLT